MPVTIKEINSAQDRIYKAFLNQGLINDEENFRITSEDDKDAPFPTEDREDSFTLGAYDGNTLCGIVSFARDGANRQKIRHKGILFRMYVGAAHRGKGIARLLIEAVLERARRIDGMDQVNLTVIVGNERAKALYEKLGFQTYGREERAIKWKGRYFDEELMTVSLK